MTGSGGVPSGLQLSQIHVQAATGRAVPAALPEIFRGIMRINSGRPKYKQGASDVDDSLPGFTALHSAIGALEHLARADPANREHRAAADKE